MEVQMKTLFTTAQDDVRIAYDHSGTGPAIMLIHGGGSDRQTWHEAGYVARLREDHHVIALDLRGHGESDLPTDPADYTTDKMGQDILAVADACGVEEFIVWGMSFGGNVSRHLAVQSERVAKIILMGARLGPAVTDEIRQDIAAFCEHWSPIIQSQREGTLDLDELSQEDREVSEQLNVPAAMAWGRAMTTWSSVEPEDFRCPVLWLVGSEDQPVMDSVREYEQRLEGSRIQLQIIEGLNHGDVFTEIDRVFATMLTFSQAPQL
jgi:pimeloyl-ACP methyl ester carboxylesterase